MTTHDFKIGDKVKCYGFCHPTIPTVLTGTDKCGYQGSDGIVTSEQEKSFLDGLETILVAIDGSQRMFHPKQLELVEKAKTKRTVQVYAWYDKRCGALEWRHIGTVVDTDIWKRVPSEDKEIEYEE